MDLTIRPYCEADRQGFGEIRSSTYRGGDPVLPDEQLLREDCSGYVAEKGGRLLGSSTVLDMTCTRGEAVLRCAGIAGVAVRPEHRREGVGSALMEGILPMLRSDGYPVASLYPFRESYYRRFGYETCGLRFSISVPEHRMPNLRPELPAYTVDASDHHRLLPCLTQFGRRYAGTNLRTPVQWWRTLGGDRPLTIYAVGDPIEAYAVLKLNPDFWVPQEVKEFIWSTQRGYESMLSLFSGLSINKSQIEWYEPGNSPFLAKFFDNGQKFSVARQIMFRVLDVPSALEGLKPVGSGEFTIEVFDPALPENGGPWRVTFGEGEVSVEPSSSGDLRMDIRTFTQALLGEPSLADCIAAGAVEGGSSAGTSAALQLLSPQRVYCADFF